MLEGRYTIKEAASMLGVEPHVLRYWEEELEIQVPRNEMGHRYYRNKEILKCKNIKLLKQQGFHLKAIKLLLKDIEDGKEIDIASVIQRKEELNEKVAELPGKRQMATVTQINPMLLQRQDETDKMTQFHAVMTTIMQKVLCENNQALYQALTEEFAVDVAERVRSEVTEEMSQKISKQVSEQVSQTVKCEVGDEVATKVCKEMNYVARMNEEIAEERFRQLDEFIRGSQKARQEAAAAKGKKKFFPKRKRK